MFSDHSRATQRPEPHPFSITIFSSFFLCRILWGNLRLDHPVDGSSPIPASSSELANALDTLFRRYDAWLRRRLHKRYGAMIADDVAQETYLRAAPYQVQQKIRSPKALLAQIADNLARDQLRRAKRDLGEETGEAARGQVSLEPTQEYAITLKEIVLSLPPKLRDVFVLSHIEGLTYQEISRLLGIPVTTVHHRMRKALEHTSSAMRD